MQVLQQTGGTINGTVTNGAGVFVQGIYPTNSANVTFTNYYGLLINQLDEWGGVTLTNRWGIYQAGSSDKNYFAGEVLINQTADSGDYKLQVNGNVYASAYYESSDIREKDVISTKKGIDGIDTITYHWKDKRNEKIHIGYPAQTVLTIIPDAVEEKNDGYLTIDYNQVHTFKISQLEQKIKELEAKLNSLL